MSSAAPSPSVAARRVFTLPGSMARANTAMQVDVMREAHRVRDAPKEALLSPRHRAPHGHSSDDAALPPERPEQTAGVTTTSTGLCAVRHVTASDART